MVWRLLLLCAFCGSALLASSANAATTVQAAVIRRPGWIFPHTNNSGNNCPNGTCRPRGQDPSQPETVEPPKFDMPPADAETGVEQVSGPPAAVVGGGLLVVAVASATFGAYREFKAKK
jgi:hypothetical protein